MTSLTDDTTSTRHQRRYSSSDTADIVIGAVVAVIGGAVIAYALTMPTLDGGGPGPGLFPGIIGGALVLFGLVLAVRTLVRPGQGEAPQVDADLPPETQSLDAIAKVHKTELSTARIAINAAVIIGSILFYVFFADMLGFLIAMFIVVFANMLALKSKVLTAVIASVVLTVVMWLVFEKGLLVQLPNGLLI